MMVVKCYKWTNTPSPASQPHCPLPSQGELEDVSPPPGALVGGCLPSTLPAPQACHQLPPLKEIHYKNKWAVTTAWQETLYCIYKGHLPCSHNKTSMLGGILRALLAMCFSNVVFPLLNRMTREPLVMKVWMNIKKDNGCYYNLLQPDFSSYLE